jgi:metal-responsive CopG/Arc/MetJ family transcriptional regulator
MMATRERGERLQIMLSKEELEALDDFRFRHRMPSRASAIREILRRGLVAVGQKAPDSRRPSRDFGVLGTNQGKRAQ